MQEAPMRARAEALYARLQESICTAAARLDGRAAFGQDAWDRPEGGGGLTRVLQDGAVFEKAAVNVSAVWGPAPPALVEHLRLPDDRRPTTFFATGISMIFHPRSPHAPTFHANLRYFETDTEVSWFGGGCDLTPYALHPDDASHFHEVVRDACARHAVADYRAWKGWCDRYFFLPHRGEARGVGGVFFDHLTGDPDAVLAFQQDLGEALVPAYLPLVERRMGTPVTPDQERWHLQRRGRYVEFNLVHDRGTRFGLQTGGRVESILASLPPRVRFDYDPAPPPEGTPERALLDLVTGPPRDWA
ncbi:MAG: oxygen-dependent coproporphyrinogen oxidase [Planctomycetes bacterium]|nr:oxygen-dependent coproporphyrinogen oxidase [Planctomycetota bacterium]